MTPPKPAMEWTIVKEQQHGSDASNTRTSETTSPDEQRKPRIDWEDPNVPVGNAPPLPRWPLAVVGLAWLVWVVFLMVMMLSVVQASAV